MIDHRYVQIINPPFPKRGWVTVDPSMVIGVVIQFGGLKVLYDRELVIIAKGTEDL